MNKYIRRPHFSIAPSDAVLDVKRFVNLDRVEFIYLCKRSVSRSKAALIKRVIFRIEPGGKVSICAVVIYLACLAETPSVPLTFSNHLRISLFRVE
jgi:hypothetical protein